MTLRKAGWWSGKVREQGSACLALECWLKVQDPDTCIVPNPGHAPQQALQSREKANQIEGSRILGSEGHSQVWKESRAQIIT